MQLLVVDVNKHFVAKKEEKASLQVTRLEKVYTCLK